MPLRSLAQITATLADHDARHEDEASILLRTLRGASAGGLVLPTDRAGPGRTAAALFDDEGQARLAIVAALSDVGLDLPVIRTVLHGLGRLVHRPRTPGVSHAVHGLLEAVEAARRGEVGWRLVAEVVRSHEGRSVRAWIEAPDTPAVSSKAAEMLADYDAARGKRVVVTLIIPLSDRLAPLFSHTTDD